MDDYLVMAGAAADLSANAQHSSFRNSVFLGRSVVKKGKPEAIDQLGYHELGHAVSGVFLLQNDTTQEVYVRGRGHHHESQNVPVVGGRSKEVFLKSSWLDEAFTEELSRVLLYLPDILRTRPDLDFSKLSVAEFYGLVPDKGVRYATERRVVFEHVLARIPEQEQPFQLALAAYTEDYEPHQPEGESAQPYRKRLFNFMNHYTDINALDREYRKDKFFFERLAETQAAGEFASSLSVQVMELRGKKRHVQRQASKRAIAHYKASHEKAA